MLIMASRYFPTAVTSSPRRQPAAHAERYRRLASQRSLCGEMARPLQKHERVSAIDAAEAAERMEARVRPTTSLYGALITFSADEPNIPRRTDQPPSRYPLSALAESDLHREGAALALLSDTVTAGTSAKFCLVPPWNAFE